ncbi:MAG: hypothetical protein ABFS02_00595 [Pseudomonadota bacterium]
MGRFLVAELASRLGHPYLDFIDLINADSKKIAAQGADCAPAVAVGALLAERIR